MSDVDLLRWLSVFGLALAIVVNAYAIWFFYQVRRPLTYYIAVEVFVQTCIAAAACYSAFHINMITFASSAWGPWMIRSSSIVGSLSTATYLGWIHARRMVELRDKKGFR